MNPTLHYSQIHHLYVGKHYPTVTQNEVVFNAPGLTLFAAPWRYMLDTKLNRLSKQVLARPYDMSDAVGYLVRLVAKNGGDAVTK